VFSATGVYIATERKDLQNIYIILAGLKVNFGLGDLSAQ
jgi:hypothetical protein